MQEYAIRRGHFSEIEGDKLESLVRDIFGSVTVDDDGSLETRFGAIQSLKVQLKDKKTLIVDTVMNRDVDSETAKETIKRYNSFLKRATGFNSKERSKRLQKKAKEGKP